MAEREQEIIETRANGVNEAGEVVEKRTNTVRTNTDSKTTAVNAIWYVYGVIAFLLGIRFIMKLFGANSANAFVDFIYTISGVLSAPFDTIFSVTTAEAGTTRSVFEPSILVAIAVYALIAWGAAKLLTLNEKS